MSHDFDRKRFDVRVFAHEQTTGDDAVPSLMRRRHVAAPSLTGLPVFGLTNDIGWGGGSVYFASKLLGFINIQAS